MELNIHKCTLNKAPHKTRLNQTHLEINWNLCNLTYEGQTFLALSQNQAYTYLRIQLVPSLNYPIQQVAKLHNIKIKKKKTNLTQNPTTICQKLRKVNIVILLGIQ